MKNKVQLGQVFTSDELRDKAISMIKNDGSILEPSCGNGVFINKLSNKNIIGIEIDSKYCPDNCLNIDFFDYELKKFDTIIGNPPYVKYNNILSETKSKIKYDIFDKRTNLYLFFIYKSFLHLKENGEIIFITPPNFLKNTSAIKLNKILYDNGTITDYYEYNDKKIFNNADVNVAIWRYEKNNFNRITNINGVYKKFQYMNGQLLFSNQKLNIKLSDLFLIKVGGVSGMDNIFSNENGNKEFVCSYTRKTNKLKKMYYNYKDSYIESMKDILMQRKIKKFDETNYWKWGRDFYHSDKKRIYVNCKTRIDKPFFIHECTNYDGSILALIVKNDSIDIEKFKNILNNLDWSDLGFKQGNKYIFTQKTLSNLQLPNNLIE